MRRGSKRPAGMAGRVGERSGRPQGMGELLGSVERIAGEELPGARQKIARARGLKALYDAWKEASATEPAARHVTGLHLDPEGALLTVYVDAPVWCQELRMSGEVLRARLGFRGVRAERIRFKVSDGRYTRAANPFLTPRPEPGTPRARRQPTVPLSPAERARAEAAASHIVDPGLREAVLRAAEASLEWKKTQREQNGPNTAV